MSNSTESHSDEVIIQGVPASPGMAVGTVARHRRRVPDVDASHIEPDMIPRQLEVFRAARRALQQHWKGLMAQAESEDSRAILAAQVEIVDDPELTARIESYIEDEQQGAQQAIDKAFNTYIRLLSESDNDRMKDRLIDLTDIRDRLLEEAGTGPSAGPDGADGDIVVAEELSPREVIQLSHRDIRGIVMEKGGHTSHAAIIARSVAIPAVVGAKGAAGRLSDGDTVCINGESGLVIINPSEETCTQAEGMNTGRADSMEEKVALCSKPSQTSDGEPFTLRANIEFPEEMQHVEQFGADGIGLLRTESIYMDCRDFGSRDKQVELYDTIAGGIDPHPVTIRLFDVGGDKFRGEEVTENNPFLGWRGIRMLLDERELLTEQLKAILTVAGRYPDRLRILVPMVSTVGEVREVRRELERCRRELQQEGVSVDAELPLGIMVEIPSTAIQAPHFAGEVDFFSIGTNDLTQYLLAVDRGNALISGLYDQQHPALWKVISHIVKAARRHDIGVELCGELGSYPVAAACLMGLGVRQLSMSPVNIPYVKKMLVQNSYADMQQLAEQVLLADEVDEVRDLFTNWKKSIIHE